MSKTFVTFFDNALLPASLMVVSKFLGVFLVITFLDVDWTLQEYSNDLFAFGSSSNVEDVQIITSYSDLFMYFTLALLFSFSIFRAVYLHSSHIKPELISSLATKNLLDLVRGSYEIYHAASVWLTFTIIANVIIIVNALNEQTYTWIAIACTATTVALAVILLQDVYREIQHIKKHPGDYSWK